MAAELELKHPIKSFLLPNRSDEEWSRIVECLQTASLSSWDDLKAVIRCLAAVGISDSEQHGADCATGDFSGLSLMVESLAKADSDRLCNLAFPAIVTAALNLADHFKDGELPRVPGGSDDGTVVSFSEPQIRTVLAHMLLCTTQRQACVRFWSDFGVWLHTRNSPPITAYLRCLFEYFADAPTSEAPARCVSFILRTVTRAAEFSRRNAYVKKDIPLGKFVVQTEGSIGDNPDEIEVDFANSTVSFGRGGTQEEILLGMSPELCITPLVVDAMEDHEALVVQGARLYGAHHGYGLDLVFSECVPLRGDRAPSGGWTQRYVIAMDATNFSYDDNEYLSLFRSAKGDEQEIEWKQLLKQLQPEAVDRELLKAYCAFQPLLSPKHDSFNSQPIATGLWGCGAFGGDPELKAFIQWIAASSAGRNVSFYTFGNKELASSLLQCVTTLHSWQATVGDLLALIEEFAIHAAAVKGTSLVSFVLAKLSKVHCSVE